MSADAIKGEHVHKRLAIPPWTHEVAKLCIVDYWLGREIHSNEHFARWKWLVWQTFACTAASEVDGPGVALVACICKFLSLTELSDISSKVFPFLASRFTYRHG